MHNKSRYLRIISKSSFVLGCPGVLGTTVAAGRGAI